MQKKEYGRETIIFVVFDTLEYTVEDFFLRKELISN